MTASNQYRSLLPALNAWAADPAGARLDELAAHLEQSADDHSLWLAWSVLQGEFPTIGQIRNFRRSIALRGALQALKTLRGRLEHTVYGPASSLSLVEDAVLVDVSHTSSTNYTSGIQRVVRETVRRWMSSREVVLVAWSQDGKTYRQLGALESARMRGERVAEDATAIGETERLLVPVGGRVIVAELAIGEKQAERLAAMGTLSSTVTSFIGYDCVPLTSGETAAEGIARDFPLYLDAISRADSVAAISESTAQEFRGWTKAVAAAGGSGPRIEAAFLGGDTESPAMESHAATAKELDELGGGPLILVVGSHEPRKNHLSVLQAAKTLWESGLTFRLVFIGSGSWRSEAFFALAAVLKNQGHPLRTYSGASDEFLATSYRLALVSVFTSLHEGFGLPVVESLRAGTPVITSNVGSMQEIADRYSGVITVDPHSDDDLADALRRVMTDSGYLKSLREQMESNSYVSWDDYADESWQILVGDRE